MRASLSSSVRIADDYANAELAPSDPTPCVACRDRRAPLFGAASASHVSVHAEKQNAPGEWLQTLIHELIYVPLLWFARVQGHDAVDIESLERENDRGIASLGERVGLLKNVSGCTCHRRAPPPAPPTALSP